VNLADENDVHEKTETLRVRDWDWYILIEFTSDFP
jgi:hypothetical protein